jgi:hypothetical protein
MRLSGIGLLLIVAGLWEAPALAQTIQLSRCLHGPSETQVQAQRRNEAQDAADLINRALDRRPRGSAYPTWEALAESQAVSALRGFAGPRGDLARKMQWGSDQPLPGWRIHYVAAQDGYAFSLTDMRDPCQLTLASNDTEVVIQGLPADRRGHPRVVPLDSTH